MFCSFIKLGLVWWTMIKGVCVPHFSTFSSFKPLCRIASIWICMNHIKKLSTPFSRLHHWSPKFIKIVIDEFCFSSLDYSLQSISIGLVFRITIKSTSKRDRLGRWIHFALSDFRISYSKCRKHLPNKKKRKRKKGTRTNNNRIGRNEPRQMKLLLVLQYMGFPSIHMHVIL